MSWGSGGASVEKEVQLTALCAVGAILVLALMAGAAGRYLPKRKK